MKTECKLCFTKWRRSSVAPVPMSCQHYTQNTIIFTKINKVGEVEDSMYCLCGVFNEYYAKKRGENYHLRSDISSNEWLFRFSVFRSPNSPVVKCFNRSRMGVCSAWVISLQHCGWCLIFTGHTLICK